MWRNTTPQDPETWDFNFFPTILEPAGVSDSTSSSPTTAILIAFNVLGLLLQIAKPATMPTKKCTNLPQDPVSVNTKTGTMPTLQEIPPIIVSTDALIFWPQVSITVITPPKPVCWHVQLLVVLLNGGLVLPQISMEFVLRLATPPSHSVAQLLLFTTIKPTRSAWQPVQPVNHIPGQLIEPVMPVAPTILALSTTS